LGSLAEQAMIESREAAGNGEIHQGNRANIRRSQELGPVLAVAGGESPLRLDIAFALDHVDES